MKQNQLIAIALVVVVLLGGWYLMKGGTGTLVLQITDAPPELNISRADVTISQVQVHMAAAGQGGNSTDNSTTEAGWRTVVEGSQTFDLIAIRDIKEFLGEASLTPGKYTQIRLTLEQALVTIDGMEYDLNVPSDSIKLTKGFDIVEGETTTLTLDFDAKESVHAAGKDSYILRPTIKVIQE